MLYFFTGNSNFLVNKQTNSWKSMFIEKHGDFNVSHFKNLIEVDNNEISSSITGTSFMGGKKLVIFDDFPLKASDKSSNLKQKQEFLENLVDSIPEENIVLFNSVNPDKRSKFYKKLKKLAEIKDFNIRDDSDISKIIRTKYQNNISTQAINLIIRYKAQNIDKIFSELEKLFITYEYIDIKHIEENIIPELEESIFQFIDDLLNLRINESIIKMKSILEQTNIYGFYNNLIANIRVQTYIELLKTSAKPSHLQAEGAATKLAANEISSILGLANRSFLVNKNYKISFIKLRQLYINLVNLDKKMKTGKFIAGEDSVFINEIQQAILKIKE